MAATPIRIRLTVAYDGSKFSGWQSQPDREAIQDHVESAIAKVTGAGRTVLHGAGRTDAGVHALAQVAHFDPPDTPALDPDAWRRALNSHLPHEIRVMDAAAVPESFHARFSATGKHYRYRIYNGDVLPPHEFQRAWHVRGDLDHSSLAEAVARFTGTHDFRAFAANRGNPSDEGPATRTISQADVTRDGSLVTVDLTGDGFLYKMVRLLTGAATRVAQNRDDFGWLQHLLDHPQGPKCPHCAPPDGLYLVGVEYG